MLMSAMDRVESTSIGSSSLQFLKIKHYTQGSEVCVCVCMFVCMCVSLMSLYEYRKKSFYVIPFFFA